MALTLNAVTIDPADHVNGVFRYDGSGTSWTQIRGPVASNGPFGGGWGTLVEGMGDETGTAFGYSGTPFDWFSVGEVGATYAVSDDTVYKTPRDGSRILQFDGFDGDTPLWNKVGDSGFLAVGGFSVVAQMPDFQGDTFLYSGNPNDWERIGPKGGAYAIADTVYRTDPLGNTVFRYTGSGIAWDNLGAPPRGVLQIFAGGFGLFATAADFSGVYQFQDAAGNWQRIGDHSASCAVTDDTVFRVARDMSVFQYDGFDDSWTPIGRPDRVLRLFVASD
ncbi:hypothetical protein ABZ815_01795 [Nonomuraea sp. NPDC047529]|uniref:hypothetical protein n=1 Tax=Nonomuraea sp. NPDC047529 TaxID=3155623 RepID=UPI0033F6DEEA